MDLDLCFLVLNTLGISSFWFLGGDSIYFILLKKILHFILGYSGFTMLCYFLLYSKVSQLYIYIHPLFFRLISHILHYRVLSRVPCAI